MSASTEAPTRKNQSASPTRMAQQRESDAYVMPSIGVGQAIIWYPDRSAIEGYSAIVTQAGERALSVAIFYPGATSMLSKNGVRYREDPDTDIIDRAEEGVWEFALDRKHLSMAAIKELGEMASRIDTISKQCETLLAKNADLEARIFATEGALTAGK